MCVCFCLFCRVLLDLLLSFYLFRVLFFCFFLQETTLVFSGTRQLTKLRVVCVAPNL